MGIKVITYKEISCDLKSHKGEKLLRDGDLYVDASYWGYIICHTCWNNLSRTDIVRLFLGNELKEGLKVGDPG